MFQHNWIYINVAQGELRSRKYTDEIINTPELH